MMGYSPIMRRWVTLLCLGVLLSAPAWADDRLTLVRRAAEIGYPPAEFELGEAYATGIGVAHDSFEAYLWYLRAAAHPSPQEKVRFEAARDGAAQVLSPSDIDRAKVMAAGHQLPPVPGPAGVPGAPVVPPAPGTQHKATIGSGFFVTADGSLLTNAHVVTGCKKILATPSGSKTSYQANLKTADAVNDLALLTSSIVPPLVPHFREDRPIRPGDGVVAVGFPLANLLSREINVTVGDVSALGGPRGDQRFLQITAPIQKGNSGGPLADMSGNIIGIVTRKINAMEVNRQTNDLPENIAFALKVDVIRAFLSANQVPMATGGTKTSMSAADVGEQIGKSTALILCLLD